MAFSIAWPGSEVEPLGEDDGQARDRLAAFRQGAVPVPDRACRCAVRAGGCGAVCGWAGEDTGGLSLAPEHRRGYGALYDAVDRGRVEIARLRRALAGLPLPRAPMGRIRLAVDVYSWLRPDVYQSAAAVLSRLPAGQEPGADDPGLAVLGDRGAGAGPYILDRGAGRGAPGP